MAAVTLDVARAVVSPGLFPLVVDDIGALCPWTRLLRVRAHDGDGAEGVAGEWGNVCRELRDVSVACSGWC